MADTEWTPRARFGAHRVSVTSVLWLMAAVYLAAHVPFLASSAYDLDGVNFTLALHEYDLAKHQPHPPGAPLFIGLGRIAWTVFDWLTPDTTAAADRRAQDVAALAVWGAMFGSLAVFGLFRLFAGLGLTRVQAAWATAATVASPLFWFSGIRPMSDVPGLALASLALGLLAPYLLRPDVAPPRRTPHVALFLAGCVLAGLAPGIRIQMAWLVWPATLAVLALMAVRRDRIALYGTLAVGAGVAVWFIPLTAIAGGPAEYLRVVRLQASDDVVGGQMLAINFSLRGAAQALRASVIAPWGAAWLGWTAAGAAAVGALRVLMRQPRLAAALAVVFGPYAVLHLGFHDTTHIRYALPLVPVVALLATQGLTAMGSRIGPAASVAIVAVSLAFAGTAVVVHSDSQAPAYQALDDLRGKLARVSGPRPVLAMHHPIGQVLRAETIDTRVLPSPVRYEWLQVADYWRAGGGAPVWFLSSRRRTDLALIDRRSRTLVRSYRAPEWSRPLIAGDRPRAVDWVEIAPPGWVALEGWAFTPEIRGVTVREQTRNRHPTPTALVRRRGGEVAVLLGGRNLGGPCATAANVAVNLDGREVQRFSTTAGESFLRMWRLPAGALTGDGEFAQLSLVAEDRSGAGQQVDVAFEQFDVQDAHHAVSGLGEGWFEPEYDEAEGVGYRWMSERAAIRVDAFAHDVTLTLRGESPRRYFPQPSILTIRAAGRVLATQELSNAFDSVIWIPASALSASDGVIEFEVSQSFVPDERSGNGDRRSLALRVFDLDVRPAVRSEG
jgi:hypothetical protein